MRREYYPAKGATFGKEAAQKCGVEYQRILDAHGGQITTGQLVEIARNPKSPLHILLEQDKDKAVLEYHKIQMRSFVNHIRVRVYDDAGEVVEDRKVSVNVIMDLDEEGLEKEVPVRVYVDTEEVKGDDSLKIDFMRQALRSIRGHIAIYEEVIDYLECDSILKGYARKIERNIEKLDAQAG